MSNKNRKVSKPEGLEAATPMASPFVSRSVLKPVEGVIVKSMSPMLKPINWPVIDGKNAVLVGVFTKCFKSGEFTEGTGKNAVKKNGTGVEIVPAGRPVGAALPLTATLRTGLDVTGDGAEAVSPFFGRTVEIELLPEKIPSKKGNAAWHFTVAIYPEGYDSKQLK